MAQLTCTAWHYDVLRQSASMKQHVSEYVDKRQATERRFDILPSIVTVKHCVYVMRCSN